MNYELSVIIPSRNEEFLPNTLADLLEHSHANTEIIAVLDGWDIPVPDLPFDPRITIIEHAESIGQRASVRQAARMSKSKYLAKCDAHCAFDDSWDVKMLEAFHKFGDNMIAVPIMKNLHVFNWLCKNGHRRYQSPSGVCKECGEPTEKEIVWISKNNPQSTAYAFNEEPHFIYMNEMKKRPEYQKMLEETGTTFTMSLQGSFYMASREKYFQWDLDGEEFGSWGNQGIELSCKAWLSGGECRVIHSTFYSHCFRTQGGDFSFPFPNPGKEVQETKQKVRKMIFDNLIPNQTRPLSWLLEKFWPVPGWSPEMREKVRNWPLQNPISCHSEPPIIPITSDSPSSSQTPLLDPLTKQNGSVIPRVGCLYYTDNELPDPLATTVRNQILKVIGDKPLVSVTLKPLDFGKNIVLPLERGKLSMHRQILRGLYELRDMGIEIAYFLEHDVLIGEGYTDFIPPDPNIYYYNANLWRCRQSDGFCVKYDHKSLSQMCAYVSKLIPEYEERVRRIEVDGFNKSGFEPGTRSIRLGGFSNDKSSTWEAKIPNIDVRLSSGKNLSASKWKPEEFRSLRSCRNWKISDVDQIEGWFNLRAMIQ